MRLNGGNFISAVIGGLVVAVLMTAMPAAANNGDNLVLGEKNTARKVTKVTTKGGFVLRTTRAATPAATFEVVSGPPFAVDSTTMVDGLNADLLDGRHANSLSRAAWCFTDNAPDGTDYSCSLSITAPLPGVLLMSGSVDFWSSTPGGDLLSCMFKEGGGEIPGSRRDIDLQNPGNQESDCATDAALEVSAGLIEITFETSSVSVNTNLGDVGAYVLYVPFNGSGAMQGGGG